MTSKRLIVLKRVMEALELHPYVFTLLQKRVDPLNHQVELIANLSIREPIRALIADEVGLGKTLESSLIVKYYEVTRGKEPWVLVVTPRALVEQWKEELKERLGIETIEITKNNIKELFRGIRKTWYVISIDTLKRREYVERIKNLHFDFVIVDEVHNVGFPKGRKPTQRYKAIEKIVKHDDLNVLLLSATPHRGDEYDYLARLKLIDPHLGDLKKLNDTNFYELTKNSIVFRRTKLDVNEIYEKKEIFKKASYKAYVVNLSEIEKEFYEESLELVRDVFKRVSLEGKGLGLVLAVLAKRLTSSPFAAYQTLLKMLTKKTSEDKRALEKLDLLKESLTDYYTYEGEYEPDEIIEEVSSSLRLTEEERKKFERLKVLANEIMENDSKLRSVIGLVKKHLRNGDSVVIFSEYKDTANYVFKALKRELGNVVALVTSEGAIVPRGSIERKYKKEIGMSVIKKMLGNTIKVLVATDVASEGLNLQKANILINYELVWSPVKVEQRLGRVWRYGQKKDVVSYVIVTTSKMDLDILDVLYVKLLAMKESIGYERPIIGETVLVDDVMKREISLSAPIFDKGEEFNEYSAIKEYLDGGKEALNSYVRRVIKKIDELKKAMMSMMPSKKEKEEMFKASIKLLGELYGDKGREALLELAKKAFTVANIEFVEEDGKIIKTEGERRIFEKPVEAIQYVLERFRVSDAEGPMVFIAPESVLKDYSEIRLFKVTINLKKERDIKTFGTLIGIGKDEKGTLKFINTLSVIKLLSSVLDSLYPAIEVSQKGGKLEMIRIKSEVRKNLLNEKLAPSNFTKYLVETERKGYVEKGSERPYVPRDTRKDLNLELEEIMRIYRVKVSSGEGDAAPFEVEEIEKKAMEIAMEYERANGRLPKDVSNFEHYDIYSVDPNSGEERFIEVKGRSDYVAEVTLTRKEYEFAKNHRDKYWLYIVIGIKDKPKLIAIKDPLPFLEEYCEVRYAFKP